mmetsp:Transcript_8077/g.14820  ORF Transcript_8077/g.14820 Transcript_8077/m.14820 type:complete len:144 (-) Transcript_8077:2-433(-)
MCSRYHLRSWRMRNGPGYWTYQSVARLDFFWYSRDQETFILADVQHGKTYLTASVDDFNKLRLWSGKLTAFDRAALENEHRLCSKDLGDKKMYCLSIGGIMVDPSVPPKFAAQEIASVNFEYMNGFKLGIGRTTPTAIDVCSA